MIKVYVKTNEENYITQIASSIFLKDATDYVEIDAGDGDKFAHAQSQYLTKALTDEQGRYNYKLVDGVVTEVAEADKPVIEVTEQVTLEQRMDAMEAAMLEMVLGGTV